MRKNKAYHLNIFSFLTAHLLPIGLFRFFAVQQAAVLTTAFCVGLLPGYAESVSAAALTKGSDGDATQEWTAQRKAVVEVARREKDANLKRLTTEKDAEKLRRVIARLGDSADETVIKPLLQIVDNSGQNESSQVSAIAAILRIASNPERTASASQIIQREAKPLVKMALGSNVKGVRRMAAQFLYRTGDKEAAAPVLTEALKEGRWGLLSTFEFYRTEDSVLVLEAMPGENLQVDKDSKPILKSAAGKGFPDEVRYRSSLMLVDLGDIDGALSALEDIILQSSDRGIRTRALSSVADIGGDRAREILTKAEGITELRSFARRMLMRKR